MERELRAVAIPATPEIAAAVERAASLLPRVLPQPEESGADVPAPTDSAAAAPGVHTLDRRQFESLIGARLVQAPWIQEIDDLLSHSRRFGEMRDHFARTLGIERDEATHAWQTAMRWMLYFLPQRYERSVPSHSEIMVRKEASS